MSLDSVRKKDGRRLDRFHVIIYIIATQLQLQFIIHYLPVSSDSVFTRTHSVQFYAFCIHHPQCNTLPVGTPNWRLLTFTPPTSHKHAQQSRIKGCRGNVSGRQPSSAQNAATARDKRDRKGRKGGILWVHTYPTTSCRPRGKRV